jgi:hypothetical protein
MPSLKLLLLDESAALRASRFLSLGLDRFFMMGVSFNTTIKKPGILDLGGKFDGLFWAWI